jgi:hypothetical protein
MPNAYMFTVRFKNDLGQTREVEVLAADAGQAESRAMFFVETSWLLCLEGTSKKSPSNVNKPA